MFAQGLAVSLLEASFRQHPFHSFLEQDQDCSLNCIHESHTQVFQYQWSDQAPPAKQKEKDKTKESTKKAMLQYTLLARAALTK